MTAFALRATSKCNAVSRLHGMASRKMWHHLWPDKPEDNVPIVHVTNGVHVPTWIASDQARLFEKYLGPDWMEKQDQPELWDRVMNIPNSELWAARQLLKRRLIGAMVGWAHRRWSELELENHQLLATGALLHPEILTIGFVRRFAEYKRPSLIFKDSERLKRMVRDRWRPIQIVFAGKSHPADLESKQILRRVYSFATDREFRGRIAFIEDYDMHIARYLVHGVDVWLNVPRRLNEASGTSGMKASLNGVLHLSVPDGWWYEGFNGANGWTIGEGPQTSDSEDASDAEALYRLLEEEIIPLYYDRDRFGVPHAWISLVKEAIRSVGPRFSTRRMLKEYVSQLYMPSVSALTTEHNPNG
jgi:starch phosphorylase